MKIPNADRGSSCSGSEADDVEEAESKAAVSKKSGAGSKAAEGS